jgi:aspartyl-tRNA synthetase
LKIDRINNWQRTHSCGALGKDNVGEEVTLMGWVNRRRDLGKVIFIDLRDRFGLTQIVFDEEFDKESHDKGAVLRNEWVIAVRGLVKPRLPGQENRDLSTGEIEVNIRELKILNETKVPPFQVDGKIDASENLRLKYRYLDLRRPSLFKNFNMRHKIALNMRQYLSGEGFLEVETPMLTKSTPEGARDYLVPSRISKGYFYALPQSPQLFKQLLMIAGFDRYFQIVRCFRDEDLRADRQPEFTQVDLELSFANEDMVMDVFEGMISDVFHNILDRSVSAPFPRIEYREAMNRFGSDKPDTRFGMELKDLSDILRQSDFKLFTNTIEDGGVVKAIHVEGGGIFSRKELDNLNQMAIESGVKGLFWAKINPEGWQSSIAKSLTPENKNEIESGLEAKQGDLILFIADKLPKVNYALGLLRLELGKRLGLLEEGKYSFLWVTRFPLLEYDNEEKRFVAVHHPFTAPLEEDEDLLVEKPGEIRARSYDLVLNGEEIGGGSVRIHNIDLQNKIFDKLGLKKEEANEKFGFFLEALTYGAPPHAGIALGFDRLVAIMTGANSLREVIAFPKTQRATCPVTDAPSKIDKGQLEEVGLSVIFP